MSEIVNRTDIAQLHREREVCEFFFGLPVVPSIV